MNQKITTTIAGASIFITIITFIGRGLGFFREVIFAASFGLSREFEIYLVATVLSSAINIVLIVLGQNYFVPNYFKTKGKAERTSFFNHALTIFLFGSIVIALLSYIFSKQIIDFYISVDSVTSKATALNIFIYFLPTIPLTAVISIFFAFLQSEKNFIAPVISNLFTNIFLIGAVPLLNDKMGIIVIPIFYLVGTVFQMLFLFMIVNKKTYIQITFYNFSSEQNKTLGFFLLFTIIIEIIGQMFIVIDRYFLNAVEKGGIAALSYSATLYQLPIVILPFAISTVLFPSFSELIQKKEMIEVGKKLNKSISVLIFLTMPISFIFFFFGEFIVMILFQRGNFSFFDSIITSNTLKIYSISLVFYAIYSVLNKFFFSTSLLNELLLIISGGLLLKIILNILLVKTLFQNGLALSTSLTFVLYCILSLIIIRKIKISSFFFFSKNLFFYLANCGISIIIVFLIQNNLIFKNNMYITKFASIIIFEILFLFNCHLIQDNSFVLIIDSLKNIKKHLFVKK